MNLSRSSSPTHLPQSLARRRIVLLGASNLTRGFSTALSILHDLWNEPLDIFTAAGHGRSYGAPSSVLGRRLPGIAKCGLWQALKRANAFAAMETDTKVGDPPMCALLTDIGNDVLYGVPNEQIADWVAECLDRLTPCAQTLAITEAPLCTIERLGPRRFHFFRTLLVPNSKLTYAQALPRAYDLNDRLKKLAESYNAKLVRPQADWFGLDPIHIRPSALQRAWREILSPLAKSTDARRLAEYCLHSSADSSLHVSKRPPLRLRRRRIRSSSGDRLPRSLYLWTRRPEDIALFGVRLGKPQPTARLARNGGLSLY